MTFGKAGVKYLKSKQQTAVGNQYSLTVSTAKDKYADGKMLYMRGYVKYSYQYVDADGRILHSTVHHIQRYCIRC